MTGIGAVVVDHDAGALLEGCVRSLLADGAAPVVVVENGAPGSSASALVTLSVGTPASPVRLVQPSRNLGFGAGVNRGLAVLAGEGEPPEWVLVSNPDLVVHPGALPALRHALVTHPAWAIVGPRIFDEPGEVYPSVRGFPSFMDAAGHALLALFNPENRFTKRYNPGTPKGEVVVPAGWVSGSCFLVRRSAMEELGGFDEAYFMYLRGHGPLLACAPRRLGRGVRRDGGGDPRAGCEHGPASISHDGRAPPLRAAVHGADDVRLAQACAPAGGGSARRADGDGRRSHCAQEIVDRGLGPPGRAHWA